MEPIATLSYGGYRHVIRPSFNRTFTFSLGYWGLTPQQQPGSYQGGEMMMMKSVIWWRKPEYPEETTDLRQVTDETFHTYGLCRTFTYATLSYVLPYMEPIATLSTSIYGTRFCSVGS